MFVVRRPRGWWEVRESRTTPAGPRARTLATFRRLTPEVVEQVRARASTPVEEDEVVQAAARAGAPVETSPADRLARELLGELATGRQPAAGVRRVLREALGDDGQPPPDSWRWLGATAAERGDALRDLLLLADRLPAPIRRRPRRRFPRLDPAPTPT